MTEAEIKKNENTMYGIMNSLIKNYTVIAQ